jgi:AcrR family transcriptional regulator
VLGAAQEEFCTHGYSGASLNTICRNAGVSKGSLFQYFDDKADLYAHLTELSGERVQAAMHEYAVTLPWNADFFGALESMVERWVRYFFDHPVERALTAASTLEPDAHGRSAVRDAIDPHYLAMLEPIIDAGVRSGQIRADADRAALLATLLILLPQVALAPHVQGLDPVLGLLGADADAAVEGAQRILRLVTTAIRPQIGDFRAS